MTTCRSQLTVTLPANPSGAYLILAFPEVALHLLELFLSLVLAHVVAIVQHLQTEHGEQRARNVVGVGARDDLDREAQQH